MTYLVLKYLHVIGAAVILGTGAGIAFFMLMAHRTNDPAFVAKAAGVVVVADMLFTATAVLAQPVTGALLASEIGIPFSEGWLLASLFLYLVAGPFGSRWSGSRCGCGIWRRRQHRPEKNCRKIITACFGFGSSSAFPASEP